MLNELEYSRSEDQNENVIKQEIETLLYEIKTMTYRAYELVAKLQRSFIDYDLYLDRKNRIRKNIGNGKDSV